MKLNNQKLPNTNITLKEFKELLFQQFKAYPSMQTNYKNKTFIISNTYYENISIEVEQLCSFCSKLNIKFNSDIRFITIPLLY
jgi:hypothetical protein